MSKGKRKTAAKAKRATGNSSMKVWLGVGLMVAILAGFIIASSMRNTQPTTASGQTSGTLATGTSPSNPPPTATATQQVSSLPVIEMNKAVMVTVELDFGPTIPTIAEALQFIERRSEPEDRVGRTFAVLDAYGEPTPEGKLHISMHVSAEKPGIGSIIFRKTGEVLWRNQIVSGTNDTKNIPSKNLLVLIDNGQGKLWTIDGSSNPVSVLDANVRELGMPLRDVWPDGTEREWTFIYSACGCPVKVMTQRIGDRTVRTKELPVMFPDDPVAVEVISRLMRW